VLIAALTLVAAMIAGTAATLWLQGYRPYVVYTGSMIPTHRPGDLVVDAPSRSSYGVGDVITFRHSDLTTDVVTHRIVAITADGITTKGDANRTPDAWTIRPDQVQGRVVQNLPDLGYLAVYLQQPAGIGSLATAALAVILLWGLFFPAEPVARRVPPAGRRTVERDNTDIVDSEESFETIVLKAGSRVSSRW
jgi:signal peptidase